MKRGREGSALLIVVFLTMMLMVLAMVASQTALTRNRLVTDETGGTQALWAAEAGIGMKLHELQETSGAAVGGTTYTLQNGDLVTVSCATDISDPEYILITADGVSNPGTRGEVRRSIEVYVRSQFHPLFYKATYVGNGQQLPGYSLTFGPDQPSTVGGATWSEGPWYNRNTRVSEADHQVDINGDGDLDDDPSLSQIYSNRVAWGWSGFVESSGSNRRLDINRDGDYGDTVTAPTQTITPAPRDPTQDNPTPTTDPNWATAARTDDADYVEGDVYVNGDINVNGGTNVFGDVDATGTITGDPVTGTPTNGTNPIPPPDLAAMNYDDIADEIVTTSNMTGYVRGELSNTSAYGALGDPSSHDNPHFHLQNGSSPTLSFGQSRDGNLIVIKGNLWIHDLSSFTIGMPSGSDVRVTVVVEGNLYIADDLNYNNEQNDNNNALLFIVKGNDDNPESYVDANRNYQYDAGETIMNDNGNGTYDGPKEGQGNVFFGDPRYGSGGVTDGYIYAQNNVYLVNPPLNVSPPTAQDTIFGVYGFLSAGGIMDLGDRAIGDGYNNFRVQYDPRLQNGEVTFKGLPKALGGGFQGLTVVSWRELP